ncbi:MAG: ABC transporter permease [Micrococcales bacterium]|nr:ABC transporter permease [Micrococcales bacterium]OJX66526.1 MAG: sugar ABC transporter [Micrococcales bacterium 72-143]
MTAPKDPAEARATRFAVLEQTPLVVIGSRSGAVRQSARQLRDILRRRELLGLLIRRDLKARYKGSALGFLWSFIRPLTQLLIYYVVVGHFLQAAKGIPDFAIYVFCGLTIFGLFSETMSGAATSIVSNQGLIKKIALPREIFPLASVGSALFNFGIQLLVLIVAAILTGSLVFGAHLLYAIPAILVVLVYAAGLGLVLSAANVYLRDVQYLVEIALMLLLWASPIIYSWTMVQGVLGNGPLLEIYTNNPVTLSVLAFQTAFRNPEVGAEYPEHLLLRLAIAGAVGLVLAFFAQRAFARMQGSFAQEL